MKQTLLSLIGVGFLAFLPGPQPAARAAELKPRTVEAFDAYMRTAEQRLQKQIKDGPFLWMDGAPARVQQVRQGQTVVGPWTGKGEIEITGGLIHDWVGAVFIPGATLDGVLALVQNYDNDKNIFKPEVVDSKLLSRNGDDFTVYLRLLKKKVLTVVLNTRHDVRYVRLDPTHCYSRSYSARIAEVENPGEPGERELAPGRDQGFLWRLNSFWRFEERDGGVYLECEAISLTRDVPTGLGWLIDPIIRALPRDSLTNTLNSTNRAVQAVAPRR